MQQNLCRLVWCEHLTLPIAVQVIESLDGGRTLEQGDVGQDPPRLDFIGKHVLWQIINKTRVGGDKLDFYRHQDLFDYFDMNLDVLRS